MIDYFASQPHYADHLLPIWQQTGGDFWASGRAADHVNSLGHAVLIGRGPRGIGPVVVAGYRDLMTVGDRPVVFVEHGVGQTYGQNHPSYPGGKGRDSVVLFVCPSKRVADLNASRYPQAKAVAVGSPPLDYWHLNPVNPSEPVVAVSFHFDAMVCPESRSAWSHYQPVLGALALQHRVIGHGHPRHFARLARWYEDNGIEPVGSFDEVLARASLYVADNSSTLYEFASTGRPVVVLNAPWYRRNVEHGLRFWEYADVGIQVNEPNELAGAVVRALGDPSSVRARRQHITRELYAFTDGLASERAAQAIQEGTSP